MITDNLMMLAPAAWIIIIATSYQVYSARATISPTINTAITNVTLLVAAILQYINLGGVYSYGTSGGLFNGMLIADSFNGYMGLLIIISGLLASCGAFSYWKSNDFHRAEFNAIWLYAISGMLLLTMAGELITIFVTLEIMSLSVYILVGFNRNSLRSNEALFKYLMLGAFAGAFFVMGSALVYGSTGSTILSQVSAALAEQSLAEMPLLAGGMMLILVALLFKVAAFPLHAWSPDVYEGAPMPVTALMSTGVKIASFAMLMRLFLGTFIEYQDIWSMPLAAIAVLTMAAGNLLAMGQDNVKRMLAASGIVHTGYLLIGAAAMVPGNSAAPAMLFYLVAYALSALGIFACLSFLTGTGERRIRFEDFNGLARAHPVTAALMSLFLLSFVGFPPTMGFFGKLYLFTAAVENGFAWLAVVGIISSVVSVYYYLRLIVAMYFREAAEDFSVQVLPQTYLAAALCGVALIWGGIGSFTLVIFPGATSLLEAARVAVSSLF